MNQYIHKFSKAFKITLLLFCSTTFISCKKEAPPPPKSSINFSIIHGPELRAFLQPTKERFLSLYPSLPDGTNITMSLISEGSYSAAKKIALGEIKATAWLVPSLALVNYTNQTRINLGSTHSACQKLFETPIVLAAKPDITETLGANDGQISLRSILQVQENTESFPLPFRIVLSHGQPLLSVTGSGSLIALLYTAAQDNQFTSEWLKNEEFLKTLSSYEKFVYSYPLSEEDLLLQTAITSPDRHRIALTSEQQLTYYNSKQPDPAKKLSGLFLREGNYFDEYHLCRSDADWVTPAHQAVFEKFARFLKQATTQDEVKKHGFRLPIEPLKPQSTPPPELVESSPEPKRLPSLNADIMQAFFSIWEKTRKPSCSVLVLDTSGSMTGDSLAIGKDLFRRLLATTQKNDRKALLTFGSDVVLRSPFVLDAASLIPTLDPIRSSGGSALYDALKKAYELLSSEQSKSCRKVIVLFTDGDDKNSLISFSSLIGLVDKRTKEDDILLVIASLMRDNSESSELSRLVETAHGILRQAALIDMELVFQEIARVM